MGKVLAAVVALLLMICAGVVVLGGYGGFEFWRVQKSAAEGEQEQIVEEVEAAEEVEAGKLRCAEGRAAYEAKEYDKAVDALDACVTALPGDAAAIIDRGRAYARIERYERAEADLQKGLLLDGTRVDGWETLAWVQVRLGDDAAAIESIARWLALRPDAGDAYLMRADAQYRLGLRMEGIQDAKHACDLGLPDGCTLEERMRAR